MGTETASTSPRAPWKWGRTDETQRVLLRAALKLFVQRGYAGTSVEDIVQLADSSVGSLYHHFGNKSGIYLALWDRWRRNQERLVAVAIDAARETGESDAIGLYMVGARAYLNGAWKARKTGQLFHNQDGPPGFGANLRMSYHEWLRSNTVLLEASDDPVGRLTVSVLTEIVGEASREVMASRSRPEVDEIIEATVAMIERLGLPDRA